jgi:hypothetical protein
MERQTNQRGGVAVWCEGACLCFFYLLFLPARALAAVLVCSCFFFCIGLLFCFAARPVGLFSHSPSISYFFRHFSGSQSMACLASARAREQARKAGAVNKKDSNQQKVLNKKSVSVANLLS